MMFESVKYTHQIARPSVCIFCFQSKLYECISFVSKRKFEPEMVAFLDMVRDIRGKKRKQTKALTLLFKLCTCVLYVL